MKKIMFNDQYGLTQAVLDGRKTQTRRVAYQEPFKYNFNCGFCMEGKDKGKLFINDGNEIVAKSNYKVGEVVAVSQRYKDADRILDWNHFHSAGWMNKMFVKADAMPHQIKITNIRAERLKSISEEDCMKEGIFLSRIPGAKDAYVYDATDDRKRKKWWFPIPIDAYVVLISKLYGIDTWLSNPLVFVYDFELIK